MIWQFSFQDKDDDTALVKKAKAGSEEAFEKLLNKYYKDIYKYCCNFVPEYAAEEIVIESFMTALDKLHQLKKEKSFKSWLIKTARYKCLDEIRKIKRLQDQEQKVKDDFIEYFHMSNQKSSLDVMIEKKEIDENNIKIDALRKGIESLRPEYSDIIKQHRLRGLKLKEAAEILGIPVNTAKTHMRRAIKELQIYFKEHGYLNEM